MPDLIKRCLANVRLRHAGIATLVAVLLAVVTVLRPLDIAIWSLQSKLFSRAPSGEIVLVTDGSSRNEDSRGNVNRKVLSAIEQLDQAGAKLIIIHTPLQRSRSPEVDRQLRAALERDRDRIILTRPVSTEIDENKLVEEGSPYFERGMRIASSDLRADFLRFVWWIEASYSDGKTGYPAVWNVIASKRDRRSLINPDYSIDALRLPRVDLAALGRGEPAALAKVRGRTVVFELAGRDRRSLKAPDAGYSDVSPGLVQIIAAETALRGAGQSVKAWLTVPATGLALLLGLWLVSGDRVRRRFYAAWLATFALVIVLVAAVGMRVAFAEPLFLTIIYAAMRATYNFRRRHLYRDPRSRLPNFAALQRDLESASDIDGIAIVVAKVGRLEAVLTSLNPREQGQYLRQIAARLALGDAQQPVYHDGGKYFSILLAEADHPDLQMHLEGLRAVASQAVKVAQREIDVTITIGVDLSDRKAPSSRISSAIAAADQARDAYRPVFIITDFEADSEEWDYSLQARLESALSENRIWIKLQPQIDLQTGQIVGAEALARWVDEHRGEISPARFILQCERVGRLDELTRRILRLSLDASRGLQDEGLPARVSANVSAIQFVDHRIADLVDRALVETGADPANIIIEITESARIENFAVAREIMERITRSGIRFSIDDFGIASANLEALYRLPFSELKVDRLFADAVADNAAARAIVANMFRLSSDLGLVSVAEGIENLQTLAILRDMGGNLGQGYCIARPQTLSLFRETIRLQRDSAVPKCRYS